MSELSPGPRMESWEKGTGRAHLGRAWFSAGNLCFGAVEGKRAKARAFLPGMELSPAQLC